MVKHIFPQNYMRILRDIEVDMILELADRPVREGLDTDQRQKLDDLHRGFIRAFASNPDVDPKMQREKLIGFYISLSPNAKTVRNGNMDIDAETASDNDIRQLRFGVDELTIYKRRPRLPIPVL